jgi:hypothetical protein
MLCRYCGINIRKKKASNKHALRCAKRPKRQKRTLSLEEQKSRDALFARHPDYMPKSPKKRYEPHFVQG